ncbi:MAG: cell envelope integrity EipB family protein [Alphaproteobacteria bacterium]
MKIFSSRHRAVSVALSLGMASLPAFPLQASDLAPYRAAYVLKYDGGTSGSGIVEASGAMTAEWRQTCEGWSVEQRIRMELINGDGEVLVTDTGYTSWESSNGLTFRFNVRTLRNEEMAEEFGGDAKLNGRGGTGTARFTIPDKRTMKLPMGTLFPMAHSEALLRAAEAGKTRLSATVFDGATKEGVAEVSAIIGKRGIVPQSENAEALITRPFWPVRLAFFDLGSKEAAPHYELGMRMFDNGVAGDQIMDFGDFRMRAVLTEIEPLPKPKC